MLRWIILWVALAALSYAVIRAGGKKRPRQFIDSSDGYGDFSFFNDNDDTPKPAHREGWHTDANGPYWG